MPTKYFCIVLCALLNLSILAQDGFIRGRLIDASTKDAIPFATIRIKGYALGVISNMDGGFQIPEKFKQYGDVLEISSMGYQSSEWRISDLSLDNINIIYLNPGLLKLEEAVVTAKAKKPPSARQIVRRAIRSIPNNYPINQFSTVGYYRDYQLDKEKYVNLNEAILEVFDQGFDQIDSATTKVRIYAYEKNTSFDRDTIADKQYDYDHKTKIIDNAYLFNYGGNEFTILRVHDAIRNYTINSFSFINTLKTDFLRNHSFSKAGDTYSGDEILNTINFQNVYPNYSALGTIYISKQDYAIRKIEYALYDARKKISKDKAIKEPTKARIIFKITTEYTRQFGKLYLNYISFQNTFMVSEPPNFVVDEFRLSRNSFEIDFNNPPELSTIYLLNNYHIEFDGYTFDIKSVAMKDNNTVVITPELKTGRARDKLTEWLIFSRKSKMDLDRYKLVFKNIRDKKDNVLDQWTSKEYNQFREFFTQQVKPNTPAPLDTLFMKKYRPIYKDQPILKPDNYDDYWMNTPLQKIEQ